MLMEQVVDEANWPQQFDMEHFKALRSFKARVDYCKDKLPYIGGGSGRMVFQIDDQTALKLAKNPKGVAQNKTEDDDYIQKDFDHIVTKVLDRHPDHLWIESEMAKKVTPNRFKQMTGGISIQEIEIWMRNYENKRNGSKFSPIYLDAEVSDKIWNNEFFYDIADMANQINMRYGDFGSLSSYGELNGGVATGGLRPQFRCLFNTLRQEASSRHVRTGGGPRDAEDS